MNFIEIQKIQLIKKDKMNEMIDSLPKAKKRSKLFNNLLSYLLMGICVVYAGWYIGNMLFGARSLDVMLDLHAQKERLNTQVTQLQEENAALQKEYFELIGLDPDSYKGK